MRCLWILCFLMVAPYADTIAQEERPPVQADDAGPWHSAFVFLTDGDVLVGDVAFQDAASTTPTDTLWLCGETQDELVLAPSRSVLLLLFQYEPPAGQQSDQDLEIGRRVAFVNREKDGAFVTVCAPERFPALTQLTTAVVVRDHENTLHTFGFGEFFFTPLPRHGEPDRILAILFRGSIEPATP